MIRFRPHQLATHGMILGGNLQKSPVPLAVLDGDEELEGLFGGLDATGGLHGDLDAGGEVVVADGVEHDLVVAEGGVRRRLAGGGFDEVAFAQDLHGDEGGGADVVVGFEFGDFEDDF